LPFITKHSLDSRRWFKNLIALSNFRQNFNRNKKAYIHHCSLKNNVKVSDS
jgi:hypothetical protein